MSYDYSTVCPHCGLTHDIPYEEVRHHIYKILGQESAKKRKGLPEHMRKMHSLQKHAPRFGKVQLKVLELAKHEDLNTLKLREIAEKVGVNGKNPESQVWAIINTLKQRGLVSYTRRAPLFQVEQI